MNAGRAAVTGTAGGADTTVRVGTGTLAERNPGTVGSCDMDVEAELVLNPPALDPTRSGPARRAPAGAPGRLACLSASASASTHVSLDPFQRRASLPRRVSRPASFRKRRFVTRTMPALQRVSMTFMRLSMHKKPGRVVRTVETMT